MIEPESSVCLIAEDGGKQGRLDVWISERIPALSRTRIQDLIRDGFVTAMDRSDWRPRDRVVPGAAYQIQFPPPESIVLEAENIPLDVLYEDADLIVVNKPAGLVVHPAPGHSEGTLVNALLFHCHDLRGAGGEIRPGIVHRLDKDTSGVMVAAKHQEALDSLADQFQGRQVRKEYVAIVAGIPRPASGCIETEIGRSRSDRKKMSTNTAHGKNAVTHYCVEEILGAFAVVRLRIETGRTHQIRVQMAHIGNPVAGDMVYGASKRRLWECVTKNIRQMLHAEVLSFFHPSTGEPVTFTAPLAPDMVSFIEAVRQARDS